MAFDDGRVPQSRCLQQEDEGVVSERADDSHLFFPPFHFFSLLLMKVAGTQQGKEGISKF